MIMINNKAYDKVFEQFPIITLDEITLRKISTEEDHKDFFNYIIVPEVAHYLSSDDIPTDLDSARYELGYWAKLFDYRHSFYWAIIAEGSNKIIGTCGFNNWNKGQRRCEISYDLDYKYWGQGIMTKAIAAIVDFAFNAMEVERVQATVALDNIPSIRVLEKVGFIKESLLKSYGVLQGEVRDFYMYAKLKG